MANFRLFSNRKAAAVRRNVPKATAKNLAGGPAYAFTPKHALAQLATTGTFNNTFYADAREQLDAVSLLADEVDNEFLAKTAVYARQSAFMKDMPAALLTLLSSREPALAAKVFARVVDNGRMLRTTFQMIRSGQFGRRGLGSGLRRLFADWINNASVGALLSASIGKDPALADIIRMARPTPSTDERRALYGWLIGRDVPHALLPAEVRDLLEYRQATTDKAQAVIAARTRARWDLLASHALGPRTWRELVRSMAPQALRMNLATIARQGLFEDRGFAHEVARKLDGQDTAGQFPYQYYVAYKTAAKDIPAVVREALHRKAEQACESVPRFDLPPLVCVDVSGSMTWAPVTGRRGANDSVVRCIDAAAVFAAAILRSNPDAVVLPFDTRAYTPNVDPGDTITTIAERLARYGGGGTDCSVALRYATTHLAKRRFGGAIIVSDNESWVGRGRYGGTATLEAWEQFKAQQRRQNVDAKLVCIDITPNTTTQALDCEDILNVGGFSNEVFRVASAFLSGNGRFVDAIDAVEL